MTVRLSFVALAALLAVASGCSDKPVEEPDSLYYTGTLWFDLDPEIVGQSFEDTVELSIEGGYYTFATLVHTDQSGTNPPICNCQGNVKDFGTNAATFGPTSIDSTDCRAKWTISGEFTTVFKGDSLIMTRTVDDGGQMVEYRMHLSK